MNAGPGRPMSAGPERFRLEEIHRSIRRARPASANTTHIALEARAATVFQRHDVPETQHSLTRERQSQRGEGLPLSVLARRGRACVCSVCGEGAFSYHTKHEYVICQACALDDSDDMGAEETGLQLLKLLISSSIP